MRIGLLGDLEVHDGDGVTDGPGAGQRSLLAVLALHAGTVLTSDRIVEELGFAPGPAIRDLETAVPNQDDDVAAPEHREGH